MGRLWEIFSLLLILGFLNNSRLKELTLSIILTYLLLLLVVSIIACATILWIQLFFVVILLCCCSITIGFVSITFPIFLYAETIFMRIILSIQVWQYIIHTFKLVLNCYTNLKALAFILFRRIQWLKGLVESLQLGIHFLDLMNQFLWDLHWFNKVFIAYCDWWIIMMHLIVWYSHYLGIRCLFAVGCFLHRIHLRVFSLLLFLEARLAGISNGLLGQRLPTLIYLLQKLNNACPIFQVQLFCVYKCATMLFNMLKEVLGGILLDKLLWVCN